MRYFDYPKVQLLQLTGKSPSHNLQSGVNLAGQTCDRKICRLKGVAICLAAPVK
jgi:hypothetical protein